MLGILNMPLNLYVPVSRVLYGCCCVPCFYDILRVDEHIRGPKSLHLYTKDQEPRMQQVLVLLYFLSLWFITYCYIKSPTFYLTYDINKLNHTCIAVPLTIAAGL